MIIQTVLPCGTSGYPPMWVINIITNLIHDHIPGKISQDVWQRYKPDGKTDKLYVWVCVCKYPHSVGVIKVSGMNTLEI